MNDVTALAGRLTELSYALDTFYFLMMGALVMWMAAGFTMLEAGLVRAKNTAEILTKNVGLYSIACIMYMLSGYSIMYPGEFEGAIFRSLSTLGTGLLSPGDNTAADVIASGGDTYYSNLSDFFFQVVFVATAMSIVSGAVAERMKLWAFFTFAVILTGFIYLEDIFAQHLVHKTALSIIGWLILGILLFGRFRFGWRGKTAIRWTLSAFAFLMLAFFGSKLVLEFIL